MKSAATPFYKSDFQAHDARPAFALRPIAYCVMLACCEAALANPNGAQVISGAVQMQGLGTSNLRITNTPGAIINWQGFSIGANEITRFIQQSPASTVLNRVVGRDISQIQGQLQSNGRVFLINPAGIVVGAGAVIDTAGFVGSTLNMLDADFLAGKLRFQGDASAGSIVNQGYIKTTHGGGVVLVAPNIENSGIIQADDGRILLAAGKKLTIGSLDANDVQFEVQAPTDSVLNIGQLLANGGAVGVFAGTLKHTGDIRANALTRDEAGNIVLKSQGDLTLAAGSRTSADGRSGGSITIQSQSGTTIVSGDVSAQGSAGKGGDIRALGDRVGIFDAARIDASGTSGGGQILIGGDYRGANASVQNASATYVSPDSAIHADATVAGDGGKLIVWGNDSTRSYGTLTARGGPLAGNGGFVETSGHYLDVIGGGDVSAPMGTGGTWLLDPFNITIISGSPSTITPVGNVFTANGDNSTVRNSDITARLGANTSVTIDTNAGVNSPTGQAGDITVAASIISSGGGGKPTLTFNADRTFTLNSGVTIAGPAGTNAGFNVVVNAGRSSVRADGVSVDLKGRIFSAAGNIAINAQRGDIFFNQGAGIIALDASQDGHNAGDGDITLTVTSGAIRDQATSALAIKGDNLVITARDGLNSLGSAPLRTDVSSARIDSSNGSFSIKNETTAAVFPTLTVNASTAPRGGLSFSDDNNSITVAGAVSAGSVTPGGAISLTGNNITVNNTITNPGGTISLTGANITVNNPLTATGGTISLTGDNAAINNAITATGGAINIASRTRNIVLAGAGLAGGTFDISDAEIDLLTAPAVRIQGISGLTTQGISVQGPVTAPASIGALSLQTGGTITQPVAGATLSATALEASGSSVNLNLANAVTTIGGVANAGAFVFNNNNNPGTLQIGKPLDFTGITASTDVTLTANAIATAAATPAARVTGNNVILDSQNGIGTGVTAPVNVAAVTLAAGAAKVNGVFVSELNDVTLNPLGGVVNAAVTGAYDVRAGGSIIVGGAVGSAGVPTVLVSGVNITGAGVVTGQTIALDSATGIGTGTAGRLNVTTGTLAARSTTSGGVFLNSGATAVTLNDITINTPAGGTTTIRNGAAGNSAYDLLGTAVVTVATPVNASSSGNTTIASGGTVIDANIGNATGATTLASSTTITNAGAAATGTVTGNTVDLTALNGIGTSTTNRVKTAAGTLSAVTNDTSGTPRSIFLVETDAVSLFNSSTAAGGTFDLTAGGSIGLIGNVTGGPVNLATTGGAFNINQTGGIVSATTLTLNTAGGSANLPNANVLTNLGASSLGAGALTLVDTGTLALTGNITATGGFTLTTSGNITQPGGALSVGPASITSGGGTITLQGGGNDFQNGVALNSGGGAVTIVDANAVTLATTNTGGAALNVTAGGAITQTGSVTASTATFNAGSNNVTLTNTANDFTGAVTLNVSGTSDVVINDANALILAVPTSIGRSLALTAGGALTLPAATLTTTGAQTYSGTSVALNGNLSGTSISIIGAATLPAASTRSITATAGGIAFNGTVTGNSALTLNSTTGTTFGGAVGNGGAAGELTSLSVIGATAMNGGAITTNQAQSYAGPVTVGADTALNSSAGSAITFGSTINGPAALTVATTGATTFGGAVGAVTPLASLTTNAGGTTAINGGSVTTTGAQTYGDPVTLGQNTTLTGTTPTFNTVAGGGFDLSLDFSGTTAIVGGNFTGIRNLASGNGGTTSLTGVLSTTGTQTYLDAVTLAGTTTVTSTGAGAAGDIAFNSTVTNPQALTVTTPNGGTTTFGGAVNVASLATDAFGVTTIAAPITTTGTQVYNDPVTLGGAAPVALNGSSVTFAGTLNGAQTLNVTTGAGGATAFGGVVGGTVALTGLSTSGATSINSNVTTAGPGAQQYGGPVTIVNDSIIVSGGDVRFGSTVQSPFGAPRALTVNAAGQTLFGGAVGGTSVEMASVTTDAAGTTRINGGSIITTGPQSYADPVTLGAATTLTTPGNVTLAAVDSVTGLPANSLTVSAGGTATFAGAVGGIAPLASLTSNAAGGSTVISGGAITTTGAQIYNAVTLGNNTTLTGTQATFNAALAGGGFDLALNFSGDTTLGPSFAGIRNLSTGNGGTTILNGAVTTSGSQTYNDAVTVASNTTVTGGGAIAFNSTVDAPVAVAAALTVAAPGTKTFAGAVGGSGPLASLQTTGAGATAINGGAVRTTGLQNYGGPVTLGADTALDSINNAAITFGGTVDAAAAATPRSLTISTGGVTTMTGAVGGTNRLASLVTGTGTTNIDGGSVNTTGAQTYTGPTLVGAAVTTLSSNSAGTIRIAGPLNAAAPGQGINVNTAGATIFDGVVGGTTAPSFLTTDAAGTTQINGGAITTTGAQRFDDAVTLGAATTLNAGGNLTFSNTLNGAVALAANSSGVTTFGGAVGGGAALTSLTTDAAGTTSITGGAITTTGAQLYNDPVTASAVTFTAGGGSITANRATNDFTGATRFNTTGAVSITDANALQIGTSTLGTGAFAVTAVGISQTGAITQAAGGTATFNGGSGAISLTQANNFGGTVALNNTGANNVALTNAGALNLGTSNVGSGTLTVNAAGPITQAGAITQEAAAGAATFNAGTNAITLAAANDFTGPVSVTTTGANSASINDVNALIVGASSVPGGTLALSAGGAISQSGGITANRLAVTTTGNASATLNGANVIGTVGASNLGTGTLLVSDTGPLNIDGLITAGAVSLATTGALTTAPGVGPDTHLANGPVTLSAGSIGTAGAGGAFTVHSGTGTVTATTTAGSAFLEQAAGDAVMSRYVYAVPVGQTIGLATTTGNITVDANVNQAGRNIALTTGGGTVDVSSGVTFNAASVNLATPAAAGNLNIVNSAVTFNAPLSTPANMTTTIGGTSIVTNNAAMTLGGALTWSGASTLQGTGTATVGTTNVTGDTPTLGTTLTTATFTQGPGVLTVANNGVLNITNAGSSAIDGTQLFNDGRVNLAGAGSLQVRNNAQLVNRNVLDVQSDAGIDSNTPAGPGELINAAGATLQKSGGAGSTVIGAAGPLTFTNTGTLNAQTGTIEYRQNANTFNNSSQFTGAGTHLVTGNSAFNGTVTNAGKLTVNGGTQTINGTLANAAGATLSLGAAGGSFGGAGTISNAGTLVSAGTHAVGGGAFTNSGSVSVASGTLTVSGNDIDGAGALGDSGSYAVAGGATLTFRDGTRDFLAASTIGGAGGVQFASTAASTFNVRGTYSPASTTIQDATTTVNFFGPTTIPVLSMTAGALNVGAGGVLEFSSAGTKSITGGTLTNFGTINVTGGNAQLNAAFPTNDGRLQIGAGATLTTTANLTNATTGVIGGNGRLNLNGAPPSNNTLTNNGTVAPGASPGALVIDGNYTQSPLGTLAIELAGTNPGVTYDLLTVNGVATLNGALNVATLPGFVPLSSNRFTFMTYNSRVGDFATFAIPASSGLRPDAGALSYSLISALLPLDDTANQLRRLQEELENTRVSYVIEDIKIKGARQICE